MYEFTGNLRLLRLVIGVLCTAGVFKFFQNSTTLQHSSVRISFSLAWLSLLAVYFNWACEASGLNAYRQPGIYSAQVVYLICFIIISIGLAMSADFYEFRQTLRIVLFLIFLLLLGDGTATSFALEFVVSIIWQGYGDQFGKKFCLSLIFSYILGPLPNGVFYFLLSNHLFYSLGHHATFASIPWGAAFVGNLELLGFSNLNF
jgi:hypothetical protein